MRKRHVPTEVSDGQAAQDCYICGSYKKRTRDCTAHFIRTDLLTEGVTESLRQVTSYAAKHEARFMKLLTEQTEDGSKRRNAAKKKELEAAEKRIAELSAIFKRLYEDSVTGRISDERFTELSADYEAEQKELKERAAVLQGELSRTLEATANAEKFMKVVRKYTSFEELTPPVTGVCGENRYPRIGIIGRETPGEAPQTGNRNLLFFRRQGRFARRIKPDLSGSQPDRNGKIFYASFTSLSHMSKGNGNLTKVTSPIMENERSYRGLNFFAERDLRVLEAISRGEYMTFGMQGKDIRQYLGDISSSAMSRIFKRLRLHGIIERVQGTYKYFPTAYGKEVIAAGLAIRNLVLIPALA